ncbi:MAG: hypothetical protein QM343_07865 [Bacillota bacterium]|jgi:hypothetical protein|nr:hypothetical protein [Bacillota bacterium]
MLKERDVFREIIRLMGVALLVYGLLTILQSGISLMYFGSSHNNSSIALILAQPFIYILVGLLFLIRPALIAAFAYPREQTAEWSSGNILIIGVKLAGVWLILAHLGTFLQHLRYYLEQIPMLGRYQVLTNSIWTAIAIYILIIIVGMVMLRYQPKGNRE